MFWRITHAAQQYYRIRVVVIKRRLFYFQTSVYPAKGRPGSGTIKLDSGAQKRLLRFRIKSYGPRPQARARLARAEVRQREGVRADRRPLRSRELMARADFLKIGHFAPFSQFLHIKGLNFPDVFYPFTSTRYQSVAFFTALSTNPSHICPRAPVAQVTKWVDADMYCCESCIATQHDINDSNRISYLSNGAYGTCTCLLFN